MVSSKDFKMSFDAGLLLFCFCQVTTGCLGTILIFAIASSTKSSQGACNRMSHVKPAGVWTIKCSLPSVRSLVLLPNLSHWYSEIKTLTNCAYLRHMIVGFYHKGIPNGECKAIYLHTVFRNKTFSLRF